MVLHHPGYPRSESSLNMFKWQDKTPESLDGLPPSPNLSHTEEVSRTAILPPNVTFPFSLQPGELSPPIDLVLPDALHLHLDELFSRRESPNGRSGTLCGGVWC